MSNIAVLGSNSFAGAAYVARAIRDGHNVIGINRSPEGPEIFLPYRREPNRSNYVFHQGDVNHDLPRILEVIRDHRAAIVVDFAGQGMVAESWQSPEQWYETNIVSKVKLHNSLRKLDFLERYVRISTPEVYGSQEELLKETYVYNPSTPYAVSHAAIDMSLRAFRRNYDFPVIFTRFANFYGAGQQLYRIVPRTIIYALEGKTLQLHGGGKAVRAFIHAEDVAQGIVCSIEEGRLGDIYHFSPERFVTIRELVEIICQRMGVVFDDLVEVAPDRPGKDLRYLMDSQRARNELGWVERFSLEEGLDSTIQWIKDNLAEIRSLEWDY
ncbi:MAG: GDP-mannose 4,6-dehydratase, partial [Leptospiraceae bacterium]|nr:GDP-mannose 4,6-dehydratase [Leptospiraceae bacterium]